MEVLFETIINNLRDENSISEVTNEIKLNISNGNLNTPDIILAFVKYLKSNYLNEKNSETFAMIEKYFSNQMSLQQLSQETFLKKVVVDQDKRDGFFLDREIHFLNARIKDLENELDISHYEKNYPYLNVKELQEYFDKSNSSILKAIERMNKKIDCKCYKDGKLYITPTGVK